MSIANILMTWKINDKYLLFHEMIDRALRRHLTYGLTVGFFCIVDSEEWE